MSTLQPQGPPKSGHTNHTEKHPRPQSDSFLNIGDINPLHQSAGTIFAFKMRLNSFNSDSFRKEKPYLSFHWKFCLVQ